jgi:hypothetical protein
LIRLDQVRLRKIDYAALILLLLAMLAAEHETAILLVLVLTLLLDDLLINIWQDLLFLGHLIVQVVFNLFKPSLLFLSAAKAILGPLLGILLKDQ